MTIEEAIEVIKKANVYSVEAIEELKSIEDKAIALDKYGEYYSVLQNCLREREACVMAIAALEKQIPKKVLEIFKIDNTIKGGKCPNCNMHINNSAYWKYCECGQRIDWSNG